MRKPEYTIEQKRDFAHDMRRNPTLAERVLWQHLRRGQLGERFQRQILLQGYIVDFYCAAKRLVVEVDGSIHDREDVAGSDAEKERAFEVRHLTLLRFTNEDVLNFPSVVLTRIDAGLKALSRFSGPSLPSPSSRGRMHSGNVDIYKRGTYSPDSVPPEQRITFEQICELDRKMTTLSRQRDMNFEAYIDTRPIAEKVWEQRYRLEEWLKKHPEVKKACDNAGAAVELTVKKGIEIG